MLGPRFTNSEIRKFLDSKSIAYHYYETEDALCERVSELIAGEKVIGWFQGKMEFGPRALGCRSIIGDARSKKMQSVMNLKIKFRESFRPFAPIILRDRASEYFDMKENQESPYMLLVAPVSESKRINGNGHNGSNGKEGLDKLKICRSTVPAITHVDYSARVQTVDPARNDRLFKLMKSFEKKNG